jgi:hypothetical protein
MELIGATFDQWALAKKPITNPNIKYMAIMIRHKIYFTNKEKFVSLTTIFTKCDMENNGVEYGLCELL